MSEPGEITNVVDAFDDENGNPFDVHITLGFQQQWMSAKILRENFINQPGLSSGGFTAGTMNVAKYTETTSRLNTRIDIGVFKDIGLYARLPLILSNNRELNDLEGSANAQSVVLAGAPGEQLFKIPFKSPTRSGIEYFAVGFDFGIFNQARDPSKPTWIFGAEGRFQVSEPMHACGAAGAGVNQRLDSQGKGFSQIDCADPSDMNRNGRGGEVGSVQNASGQTILQLDNSDPSRAQGQSLEGNFSGGRKPGVGRGTTGLEIHSIMSRRVKYVEPYGGFRALFEFANSGSDYGKTNLDAVLTSSPPLQGWMIVGIMFHPYENREQFQRLSFDTRFTGTYRSQGRDYSPLFDALGASDAPSLRRPNFAEFKSGNTGSGGTGSVVNEGSQKVYVTGLTDVAAHGSFQIAGSAAFQAAEFVKFQLGLGYTYVQPHEITGDQPCNPNFKNDQGKSGPCSTSRTNATGGVTRTATGIPNPLYRPAIDIVGRRFLVDAASQIDLWVQAVVMF